MRRALVLLSVVLCACSSGAAAVEGDSGFGTGNPFADSAADTGTVADSVTFEVAQDTGAPDVPDTYDAGSLEYRRCVAGAPRLEWHDADSTCFDTEPQIYEPAGFPCAFSALADGVQRCLPRVVGLIMRFEDASCTVTTTSGGWLDTTSIPWSAGTTDHLVLAREFYTMSPSYSVSRAQVREAPSTALGCYVLSDPFGTGRACTYEHVAYSWGDKARGLAVWVTSSTIQASKFVAATF